MTGLFPGLRHVTNMKRIRSDFSIISPLPPPPFPSALGPGDEWRLIKGAGLRE